MIAWDAVPGAETYNAEVTDLGGNVLELVAGVSSPIEIGDLVIDNVSLNQDFRVRVQAVESATGPGDWSDYLSLKLLGLPAPLNVRVEVSEAFEL
jgi:hypothetical protein